MPKLVARGPGAEEKRCRIRPERPVRLGRRPDSDDTAFDPFEVSWEAKLSRNQADLKWARGRLEVARAADSKNPIYFKGEEKTSFSLVLGEHFVVGETTFTLSEDCVSVASDDPTPLEIVGYTMAEMRDTRYRDPDQRIEVLATLPDVLRNAASDEELFSRLVFLLFAAIPDAGAAAIVRVLGTDHRVEVFYWDSKSATTAEFKPSKRLIVDAVEHRRQSVRSLWGGVSEDVPEYTIAESLDWAFCTPVPGEACAGWGLYVAGKSGDRQVDLRPDVKFTELVADLLGAMRDFRSLQRQQATLGRFFSPVTLPMLSSAEGEKALEPRQTEVTVLFCDLRGFSREAEKSRDDLMGLLNRVSHALDVMTKCIHSHQGVIGDFQGDAALAFWGWPLDDGTSANPGLPRGGRDPGAIRRGGGELFRPPFGFPLRYRDRDRRRGRGKARDGGAIQDRCLRAGGQPGIAARGNHEAASSTHPRGREHRLPRAELESRRRSPVPPARDLEALRHGPRGHGERASAEGGRAEPSRRRRSRALRESARCLQGW